MKWIKHDGGECPVAAEMVKYRCRNEYEGRYPACSLDWHHYEGQNDGPVEVVVADHACQFEPPFNWQDAKYYSCYDPLWQPDAVQRIARTLHDTFNLHQFIWWGGSGCSRGDQANGYTYRYVCYCGAESWLRHQEG